MRNKMAVSTYSFSNILYTEKMPTLEDLFRTIHNWALRAWEIVAFQHRRPGRHAPDVRRPRLKRTRYSPDGSAPQPGRTPPNENGSGVEEGHAG